MLVSFNLTSSEQGEAKSSGMSLGLDLYRHWTLSETSDLLFAAGLKYNSMTNEPGGEADKEEETQIILPNFTFAVETNLLEWATVRAGVNNMHELNSTNKVGDTEVKTMGASEFDLAFGLGLEYGGFKLDLDLTPGFFVDPVSFITGFNDQALASQFSITYAW